MLPARSVSVLVNSFAMSWSTSFTREDARSRDVRGRRYESSDRAACFEGVNHVPSLRNIYDPYAMASAYIKKCHRASPKAAQVRNGTPSCRPRVRNKSCRIWADVSEFRKLATLSQTNTAPHNSSNPVKARIHPSACMRAARAAFAFACFDRLN